MMEKHSIFKATTLYTIKAELLTIDQYIDSRITSLNPHTLLNNGDYVDIVITGFNYYSSYWNNPSGELARAIDGSIINSYRVKGFVLTVSLKNAVSQMKEILSTTKPKLIIGMGLNPATRFVDIELVSVNQTYFTQPDVDGNIVRLQKILDTGPQIAYSTLPLEGIMRECSEKKSLPHKAKCIYWFILMQCSGIHDHDIWSREENTSRLYTPASNHYKSLEEGDRAWNSI
jgi:hypothetical protein